MESILSKENKSDKLAEDLNSRCNVFVQVTAGSEAEAEHATDWLFSKNRIVVFFHLSKSISCLTVFCVPHRASCMHTASAQSSRPL